MQTLNTVFAAEDFTAANKFAVTKTGTIDRNQSASLFVRVPTGTPRAEGRPDGGGTARGRGPDPVPALPPVRRAAREHRVDQLLQPAGAPAVQLRSARPAARVTNPLAGVWEIVVEARRTSDAGAAPYSVTASVLGTTISPNPDVDPVGDDRHADRASATR